jgi:uncharacterized protein YkwD
MNSWIQWFLLVACLPAVAAPLRPDLPAVASLVVSGTNDFRRGESRDAVEVDSHLEAAAQAFASFIASSGKFDHDADGATPADRARRHGYDYCLVAENLAYQFNSAGFSTADLARRLVEGWKKSPGHRKNLLERDVVHTAVAVAASPREGHYYAVQMFGRPRSASVAFEVRNASNVEVRYRIGERPYTLPPNVVRTHTECIPEALRFELPGESPTHGARFTPRKGARFVVKRERGQLAVQPE